MMKMKSLGFCALLLLVVGDVCPSAPSMTADQRRAYRDQLVKILPDVPAFDQWLKKTDELPPDFDALPKMNALPDPLTTFAGNPVLTPQQWKARRTEILDLYQKYVWGTIPPHPRLDHVDMQETPGQGFVSRTVVLHVGPEGKPATGLMHVTLQVPSGKGPFPVVMGPGLVGGFGARSATTIRAHGYIVASIAASDGNDDSAAIAALFPGNDVGTLPRRGWAASCVVDYLLTLPEVDARHIAITGYSRDGKAMLIGAALDQRIASVVAGSPGVGGILAFRNAGEKNQAESIQSTTMMFPDWFNPRLRFFAGREDRLPVDGNLLLATIAPRPFIEVAGLNDEVSNDWGDEQSFHSAQKVYELLGAPKALGINRVPGNHGANDWEASMGFLDTAFGKSDKEWVNHWMFPWDYEAWKKNNPIDVGKFMIRSPSEGILFMSKGMELSTPAQWETRAALIRREVTSMLGDMTPSNAPITPAFNPWGTTPQQDVPAWVIGRSTGARAISEFGWYSAQVPTATRTVTFNGVKGTLYSPATVAPGTKLPVVIWLHSYSYPLGYMWVYHREMHPILALVKAGYAVLAYDQEEFGSRMIDAPAFYEKYPKGSLMGKLVEDARAAVEALGQDAALDSAGIYLFGYGLGGNVALHTAALEPKVAGVVSICGFTPMRTETAAKGTNEVAQLSVVRGLIPRLGAFVGQETRIPYDYDELIATIAPRPVYILSPQLDRDATPADVHTAVEEARKVFALYGAEAANKLKLDEPWDYNRLSETTQDRIIAWMKANMK